MNSIKPLTGTFLRTEMPSRWDWMGTPEEIESRIAPMIFLSAEPWAEQARFMTLRRQAADEEFVTAILAQVAGDGTSIELLNCGHPPPLVLDGTGHAHSSRLPPACRSA